MGYHRMPFSILPKKPLYIRDKYVFPQELHAERSFQQVLGVFHVDKHLEQNFMEDYGSCWVYLASSVDVPSPLPFNNP